MSKIPIIPVTIRQTVDTSARDTPIRRPHTMASAKETVIAAEAEGVTLELVGGQLRKMTWAAVGARAAGRRRAWSAPGRQRRRPRE